jgi:hypothetical protein
LLLPGEWQQAHECEECCQLLLRNLDVAVLHAAGRKGCKATHGQSLTELACVKA